MLLLRCGALCFLLLSLVLAGTIDHSISLTTRDINTELIKNYDYVSIAGFDHLSEVGHPALPAKYLSFIIPPDAQFERLEVTHELGEYLPGTYTVFPAQKPVLTSGSRDHEFTLPDEKVYSLNELYPSSTIEYVHEGNLSGYRIVSILVKPLRYNPTTKRLYLSTQISFRIHYRSGAVSAKTITESQKRYAAKRVRSLVVNTEQINTFSPPTRAGVWSSEYIIITDTLFVDAFEPLRRWKMKKGLKTDIVTTTWIYDNYTGTDNAEQIRNFIIEAADSGALYFLLAGQCDWETGEEYVPRRDAYCWTCGYGGMPDEDTIPCDMYYSDLDGTWDGNSNGTYGEMSDSVDMYSDVLIGRAPVKDSAQIAHFMSKVITYETAPSLPYIEKALLAVGNLHSGNHGTAMSDTIADTIPDNWQKSKIYEDYGLMSRYVIRDSIDQGFHLSNMMGHGNQTCITYTADKYYCQDSRPGAGEDVNTQTNDSTEAIIITSNSCLTGAVEKGWSATDNDCLAENMINTNKHCAVAIYMNTRYGWTYPLPEGAIGWTDEIILWFWRKLFGTEIFHIGDVVAAARDAYVPKAVTVQKNRYCLFSLNLFGDPEMPIWKERPELLVATYDSYVYTGTDTFVVTITDTSGAPVTNALVCCWIPNQDPEMHVTEYTDTSGNAVLNISPTTPDDTMYVTVTKQDYIPHQGHSIIVVSVPIAPFITEVEKSENNVVLTWNSVATDTFNNPVALDYYVIYRDTSPSFIPDASDSIGAVLHPDTMYEDMGALTAAESYYYLIKAIDTVGHKSKKSNMGYVLDRFFNYNTDRSSRNWVSLPWHSGYSNVSDLVADLSPNGDPLESVTNLRDDMVEETWLWDTDFMMWFGPNDFIIDPGRGYEMVATKDTTLVLVGSNDPDGLISLNYNTDRSSRNWVSIPFNAAYSTVDDIAQEYSPAGDPLESISNLRDDMVVETWLYDTDFMMWFGPNDFAIVPSRGYEFVPIKDTIWDPNEYTNEAFALMLAARGVKRSDVEVYGGQSLEPDRAPVWTVKETEKRIDYSDPKNYTLVTRRLDKKADYREPGISHIVRVHLDVKKFDNLVFTAYRPEQPYDVLTENMIGSCVVIKGDQAAFFFNVANFKRPWQDGEEVIVIIEALRQGRSYFTVLNVILDKGVDIQDVVDITLMPIPEPVFTKKGLLHWSGVDDDNVVGYSLYKDDKRLNERVLKRSCYSAKRDVNIRPVIRGGYETVYGSQGAQSRPDVHLPLSYAFNLFPNPFVTQTRIDYALPRQTSVEIVVYDVSGRQVKILTSGVQKPGYYTTTWSGIDGRGRKVSSGVYFVRLEANEFKTQDKILLVK